MNIKKLAEQSGITFDSLGASYTSGSLLDILERFAELIRADEREAIIDIVARHGGSVEIEAAIMAMGEK